MGNRYWITGVQVGILIALAKNKDVEDLLKKILDNQYLCEAEELSKLKYKEAKKTSELDDKMKNLQKEQMEYEKKEL